jgi:hypothetical protein
MTGNINPNMKRLIALALVAVSLPALSAFAGEPVASSKEVVAPAPPPPPASYFRANEWSVGLFGTYGWTYDRNRRGIDDHYWGGGIDGQYFPLQYLGFAIEGDFFTEIPIDEFAASVFGNVIFRYPLDNKSPNLHLAPYAFAGVGGLFNTGTNFTQAFRNAVAFRHKSENDVVGDFGGGLEYRFTPHIGIFSDVRFNLVDGPKNNYLSTRFGLRFAF